MAKDRIKLGENEVVANIFLEEARSGEPTVKDSYETGVTKVLAQNADEVRGRVEKLEVGEDSFNGLETPVLKEIRTRSFVKSVAVELKMRGIDIERNDAQAEELKELVASIADMKTVNPLSKKEREAEVENAVKAVETYYFSGQNLPKKIGSIKKLVEFIQSSPESAEYLRQNSQNYLSGWSESLANYGNDIAKAKTLPDLINYIQYNTDVTLLSPQLLSDLGALKLDAANQETANQETVNAFQSAIEAIREAQKEPYDLLRLDQNLYNTLRYLAVDLPSFVYELNEIVVSKHLDEEEKENWITKQLETLGRTLSGDKNFTYTQQIDFSSPEQIQGFANQIAESISMDDGLDYSIGGFKAPEAKSNLIHKICAFNQSVLDLFYVVEKNIEKSKKILTKRLEAVKKAGGEESEKAKFDLDDLESKGNLFNSMVRTYINFAKSWKGTESASNIEAMAEKIKNTAPEKFRKAAELTMKCAELRGSEEFKERDNLEARYGIAALIQVLSIEFFKKFKKWPSEEQLEKWSNKVINDHGDLSAHLQMFNRLKSGDEIFSEILPPQKPNKFANKQKWDNWQAQMDYIAKKEASKAVKITAIYNSVVGDEKPETDIADIERNQLMTDAIEIQNMWLDGIGISDNSDLQRELSRHAALTTDFVELVKQRAEILEAYPKAFAGAFDAVANEVMEFYTNDFEVGEISEKDESLIEHIYAATLDKMGIQKVFAPEYPTTQILKGQIKKFVAENKKNYVIETPPEPAATVYTPSPFAEEMRDVKSNWRRPLETSPVLVDQYIAEEYKDFQILEMEDVSEAEGERRIAEGIAGILASDFSEDMSFCAAELLYKKIKKWTENEIEKYQLYAGTQFEAEDLIKRQLRSCDAKLLIPNRMAVAQSRLVDAIELRLTSYGFAEGDVRRDVIISEVSGARVNSSENEEKFFASVTEVTNQLADDYKVILESRKKVIVEREFASRRVKLIENIWSVVDNEFEIDRALVADNIEKILDKITQDKLLGIDEIHIPVLANRIATKAVEYKRTEVKEKFREQATPYCVGYMGQMELRELNGPAAEIAEKIVDKSVQAYNLDGPAPSWLTGWRNEVFIEAIENARDGVIQTVKKISAKSKSERLKEFEDKAKATISDILADRKNYSLEKISLAELMRIAASRITRKTLLSNSDLYTQLSKDERSILREAVKTRTPISKPADFIPEWTSNAPLAPGTRNLVPDRYKIVPRALKNAKNSAADRSKIQPKALKESYVQELDAGIGGRAKKLFKSAGDAVRNWFRRS